MKLTPRAHGYRFRRTWWPEAMFVDITNVKAPDANGIRTYYGWDQKQMPVNGHTFEHDGDWIRIGSTKKLKRAK